jgi:hypothetical protein
MNVINAGGLLTRNHQDVQFESANASAGMRPWSHCVTDGKAQL